MHPRILDRPFASVLAVFRRDRATESDSSDAMMLAGLIWHRMMTGLPPGLDWEICDHARLARDWAFDGAFFTGVRTTWIYCRPVCPVRPSRSANIVFFGSAAAAERAGFRPCLRCRPETAPGTPAWNGTATTVVRGMRLIEEGFLDESSVAELAERLGVGPRHLLRLFRREPNRYCCDAARTGREAVDRSNDNAAV